MKVLSKERIVVKGRRDGLDFKYVFTEGYDTSEKKSLLLPRTEILKAIAEKEKYIEEGHEFEILFVIKYGKPSKKHSNKKAIAPTV